MSIQVNLDVMMAKRKISLNQLSQEVGISTATISRVNKCLVYGSEGYRLAIDRLKEKAQ